MRRHLIPSSPARSRRRVVPYALLLALVALVGAPPCFSQTQAPTQYKPQGYVNDFANVLSQATRDQLTAISKEVDEKAHAQIAVVTVPTTNGQPIQDYTFDLATKWGVGPKQSNRGVLILFAVNDHKYWTQVGYGLEPILPDGKVGGFGREAVPILRQGNYDAAVLLMTRRIAEVIAQDAGITLNAEPQEMRLRQRPRQDHTLSGPATLLLVLFVIGIIYLVMKSGGSSGRGGSGGGGSGWWIAPLIASSMGRRGWGAGGFGGSGWGGGGGGGGGFGGFGGGSFGGGGAGGSW
jgi:uncharacterized protein